MFDHEKLKVYFQGEYVNFKDATISIANTGFMYGLGVFSGIRAHFNKGTGKLYIFRPREHFERFSDSCKLFHYAGFLKNYDYDRFREVLVTLLKLNNIQEDAYIRITNYTDQNTITPKFHFYKDAFCAFLYAIGDYVPTSGMKCMVSSWTRVEDNSMPARAKAHGSYVNTAFAKTEALMLGFDEAIFLDRYGHVVEGSAENIFLVLGDTIVTPPVSDNILEGITRRTVMTLAQDQGFKVVERSIDRSELYKANEVFLTGTGAQVSPVVKIDSSQVGTGEVGPVAKQLQQLYFRVVRGEEPKYAEWLVEV
jgi:branched-chain amino acid aminotransferase